LIEEYSVEYVAFACSVLSYNSDDADMFFLIGFDQPVDCFLIDDDF
jgi:hypothetical protein